MWQLLSGVLVSSIEEFGFSYLASGTKDSVHAGTGILQVDQKKDWLPLLLAPFDCNIRSNRPARGIRLVSNNSDTPTRYAKSLVPRQLNRCMSRQAPDICHRTARCIPNNVRQCSRKEWSSVFRR
jgi:hypothetical protein